MAIAWQTPAGEGNYANTTSPLSISKPFSPATDDILVYCTFVTADSTLTLPSGFTTLEDFDNNTIGNEHRLRAGWKRATGSEPSTYDFTHSGSFPRGGIILCYRGADTSSTPFDATASVDGGTGTTTTGVSVTTTVDNCMLIYFVCCWNGRPYGSPSSWTERYDNANVAVIGADEFVLATAGSSGSITSTQLTGGKTCILLALKPATSSVTIPHMVAAACQQPPQFMQQSFQSVTY